MVTMDVMVLPWRIGLAFILVTKVLGNVDAPALQGPCTFGYFKVKNVPGCRPCPRCLRAWGTNQRCLWTKEYPPDDIPTCEECVSGKTYNDHDNNTYQCRPCTPLILPPHHVETRKCTKIHDRQVGCERGFYADAPNHDCSHQCCYCNGTKSRRIKKCERDGMEDGRFCAPTRSDKKCDIIEPKTTVPPTTTTSELTSPKLPPTETTTAGTEATVSSTTAKSTLPQETTTERPATTTAASTTTPIATTSTTATPTIVTVPSTASIIRDIVIVVIVLLVGIFAIAILAMRYCRRQNGPRDEESLLNACGVFFRKRWYGSVPTGEDQVVVELPSGKGPNPDYAEIQDHNQNRRSDGYISSNTTSVEYLADGDAVVVNLPPSTRNTSTRNSGLTEGPVLPPRNASKSGTGTTVTPARSRSQTPVSHFGSRDGSPLCSGTVSPSRTREATPDRRSRETTPIREVEDGSQAGASQDSTDCACPVFQPNQVRIADQRRISREQVKPPKGRGIRLSKTRRRHRKKLAVILDLRGENIENNWYELGHYVVAPDEKAKYEVEKCQDSYYGGYQATKAMLIDLERSQSGLPLSHFVEICEKLGRSDVTEYLMKCDFKTEKFFELPHEHKSVITTILERRKEDGNYWKDFADVFGFTVEQINAFQEYKKRPQKYSPTEELIEVLIHWKSSITIEELQVAAIAIQRRDAHECLDRIAEELLVEEAEDESRQSFSV